MNPIMNLVYKKISKVERKYKKDGTRYIRLKDELKKLDLKLHRDWKKRCEEQRIDLAKKQAKETKKLLKLLN